MCDGFNHGALQTAVAQICQSMGWDALQKSTHDLLTDVLQKYLEEIAKSAHGYSQLCKFRSFRSTFLFNIDWHKLKCLTARLSLKPARFLRVISGLRTVKFIQYSQRYGLGIVH